MMRADLINGLLPQCVQIGGDTYPVNWDFRTGMQIDSIRSGEGSDEERLLKMLFAFYPKVPEDINAAVNKLIWFYKCGEATTNQEEKKERYQQYTSKEPAYSFEQDTPYIYAAFKEQYGIDLTEETMHWWKFMALFESLNEDTKMSRIMYYRKVKTAGMSKAQRAYVNDMKKLYKIKTGRKRLTLAERDQRWLEYVNKRAKETK